MTNKDFEPIHRNVKKIGRKLKSFFGLMFQKKTPIKFILLGKYRVGSNLLTKYLQNHSEIVMHGEIFNASEINKHPKRLYHPDKFIYNFFRKINYRKKAKGFKLMYKQLTLQDFDKSSWPVYTPKRIINDLEEINNNMSNEIEERIIHTKEYIFTNSEIKFIHLKRKNLLEQLISFKRAFSEDNWHDKIYSLKTLNLSKKECNNFFNQTKFEQEEYDLMIEKNKVLEIYYEDLIEDRENTLKKIFKFLNVKDEKPQANFKKQSVYNKEEIVTNYSVLKKEFINSEWAHFFN